MQFKHIINAKREHSNWFDILHMLNFSALIGKKLLENLAASYCDSEFQLIIQVWYEDVDNLDILNLSFYDCSLLWNQIYCKISFFKLTQFVSS